MDNSIDLLCNELKRINNEIKLFSDPNHYFHSLLSYKENVKAEFEKAISILKYSK